MLSLQVKNTQFVTGTLGTGYDYHKQVEETVRVRRKIYFELVLVKEV